MTSDFLDQIGVMVLTFGVWIAVGLASRRMERSDWLTLLLIPLITFPIAILPGIIAFGFDKNSATYVLGALAVVVVATLNYRFQPRKSEAKEPEARKDALPARVAKEA
jgi:hypothetical protein